MASVIYRRGTNQVYVYVWDRTKNKQVQVPRDLTKHLDGQPPEVVQEWVARWEAENGPTIVKTSRRVVYLTDRIRTLYEAFRAHREAMDTARTKTLDVEEQVFNNLILKYFIGVCEVKDPKRWHELAHGFVPWLIEEGHKTASIKRAVGVLQRFGEYLVYSRYMAYGYVVKAPKSKKAKTTPLKVRITPEEVITKSRALPTYLELACLVGYFAALEPSILFALRKEDFLAGGMARELARTHASFSGLGLGSGLSVLCRRAASVTAVEVLKDGTKIMIAPILKNAARYGVVNIWSAEAAQRIAEIIRTLDGPIFPYSRNHMEKRWRELVGPVFNATPHDLRRASCLYLGRTLRVPPTLLQEHMRHAQLSTTMLYCRDPQLPEVPKNAEQDWDDVS